jgi:site-specific recombinase XerD
MGKLVLMPHPAPPKKIPNLEQRTREHLFPNEVAAMIKAAKQIGRHCHRDSTLILLAYRHACGFYLASNGYDTRAIQAYLGHKNIQHTVRYTELSPGRFKDFWND